MKKLFLFVLVGILPMFLFNSCGSVDLDTSLKSALIGAWKTSMSSSVWKNIYLMPDGKMKFNHISQKVLDEEYTFSEKDQLYRKKVGDIILTYDPKPNAYWAFDENTKTLSMFTDDGYFAYTYVITMSEDRNSFTGVSTKGSTYTFIRVVE